MKRFYVWYEELVCSARRDCPDRDSQGRCTSTEDCAGAKPLYEVHGLAARAALEGRTEGEPLCFPD